ncbi:hypothetical protein GCM10007874_27900 [Labrys miyagiensis]|uniref:Uncharacterized protein n=1 Tax=Labrys miyagiensis TaxID=346912 RepID=A0ABQ6CHF4_9HYPH|nr:hypothetical protein GCM10007874_27900 [Labrys miyagiensis]
MSRLHRIGGTWDEGVAGLKPVTLRPGITGHFHGVPIPSVPLVTPGGRLRKKQDRHTPTRLDRLSGWMEAFGAGLYRRRPLTPHSVRE